MHLGQMLLACSAAGTLLSQGTWLVTQLLRLHQRALTAPQPAVWLLRKSPWCPCPTTGSPEFKGASVTPPRPQPMQQLLLLCPSHPTLPTHPGHVQGKVLKESPNVVAGVDLLHLHLRVHVAVVDEVHVGHLHLPGEAGMEGTGTVRRRQSVQNPLVTLLAGHPVPP